MSVLTGRCSHPETPPGLTGARVLAPSDVRRIRERRLGDSALRLAWRYGVSERTIVRVRNGHTYTEPEYR